VIAALGVTAGGPAFRHKGIDQTPTAVIYFCPPEGDGSIFTLTLGPKEKKEWKIYFTQATAYFAENILPRVARAQLRLQEVVPSIASIFSMGSPPRSSINPPAAAPPVDQTPGIKDGKRVRDPRKPNRIGTIREVREDGKAIVDWDNEEKERNRAYKTTNLQVLSVLQETTQPIQANQRVQIISGIRPELILKTGTVNRSNAMYSFVTLDDDGDSGSSSEPIKIKREYLRIIADDLRPVPVPINNFAAKFALESFAKTIPKYIRKRKIQLTANFSFEKFVEDAKRKMVGREPLESKHNIQERPKRNTKKSKSN
jgi:hypothetical protein